jgi:prepilin-type N-terminal cleavage/methylation domain-containing protein
MTSGVSKYQLVSWLLKANKHRRKGFTLIELLVAIIIGSLIVSALLFLVTELNRMNGREELLTQTQQSMRRAIDYIESDLSEAVYVYSTPPAALISQLDDAPAAAEATPILAFWRLDPVDTTGLDCSSFTANSAEEAECTTLEVRQSAYTLVVYFQSNDNADNEIWEGRTRIMRYQLPKYTATGVTTLTQRDGYQDPSLEDTDFANWTKDPGETTDGDLQVLTDFVAAVNTNAPACPDLDGDNSTTEYERTPAASDSFYVCARSGDVDAEVAGFEQLNARTNQSVILYLTGDASRGDNDVLTSASNDASRLPTLESEVLIRGVIEKPRS